MEHTIHGLCQRKIHGSLQNLAEWSSESIWLLERQGRDALILTLETFRGRLRTA